MTLNNVLQCDERVAELDEALEYSQHLAQASCAPHSISPSPGSTLSHKQLRELCWNAGAFFPTTLRQIGIGLFAADPDTACVHWNLDWTTICQKKESCGVGADEEGLLFIRISDVTDIDYDGHNAHRSFTIPVGRMLRGVRYQTIRESHRNLVAEIGVSICSQRFIPCARSNTMLFSRPQRSNHCSTQGLYVDHHHARSFGVDNITTAAAFERMHRIVREQGAALFPRTAVFVNEMALHGTTEPQPPITTFVKQIIQRCESMGSQPCLIDATGADKALFEESAALQRVLRLAPHLQSTFSHLHKQQPFDCIQFHDWYSAAPAVQMSLELQLPLVGVVHSIEQQRCGSQLTHPLSAHIDSVERFGIGAADYIITPNEPTRQALLQHFGKAPERVLVVGDGLGGGPSAFSHATPRNWGVAANEPVVLFANELCWGSGADLLLDALPDICREFSRGVFIFAGEGQMRGELERRASESGLGHRCRFVGTVASAAFSALLSDADMVVIPSRTYADRGLAAMAMHEGKPVVATHQAAIGGLSHGVNGLLIYDNPGSISWGIKEMLGRIRSMPRYIDNHQPQSITTEATAADYMSCWMRAVASRGVHHA
jgi:glycosyltransferase involved in cell wall biosynthesis